MNLGTKLKKLLDDSVGNKWKHKKKITIDKAFGSFKEQVQNTKRVSERVNSKLLFNAWESDEFYKILLTGEVSHET